jgi:hypothetical protein
MGMAVLATLIAIFYTEEDWRGKRAWENCKRDLEAKGVVMDWSQFIPPPVPDGQNFFKAPKMTEWFVRQKSGDAISNELNSKLNADFRSKQHQIAELTVVPVSTNALAAANADLVLRYNPLGMVIFSPVTAMETNGSPADFRLPLIKFVDVPITLGISNLALQAGMSVTLDPKIGYGQPDQNGKIKREPNLSFQLSNITAKGALVFILNTHNLQLIYDPETKIALITTKDADKQKIHATPEVLDELRQLFAGVIGTNLISVYQNYVILARPPEGIKPMRIVVESDTMPDASEVRELFAESFPNGDVNPKSGEPLISIEAEGSDAFRVMLEASSAADYLAWSDQFEPDFNLIREGLKRPYARMDGDYTLPMESPVPNFVTVRKVAQTLAQRAKCDLLLDRPERAVQELTLLHDLCRLMKAAPTGKPVTLVAAMINVAVTGLYADTIAFGLQSRKWREPQLIALQTQLAEIQLAPFVIEALTRTEPAAVCRDIEVMPLYKIFDIESVDHHRSPVWTKKVAWWFWPRGWTYQNMVNIALLEEKPPDGFNPTTSIVAPRKINEAYQAVVNSLSHVNFVSPYKIIAQIAIANFSRALQSTAHNQTMVNEAEIACALDRYRLAHGNYPESLDALVPQFIDKLPHDLIGGEPLTYRPTGGGNFLLYSIGWNETDDGGVPAESYDSKTGDWVWQYPVK